MADRDLRAAAQLEEDSLEFLRRKLVLATRASAGARQLRREMEAWRDAEREALGLRPPAAVPAVPPAVPPAARRQRVSPPAAARPASTLPPSPLPLPVQQHQQQQLPRASAAPAAPARAANATTASELPCGPLPPPEARTGGASGRPWGLGGVWLEPFSLGGAQRTRETILGNLRRPRRNAAAAAAAGGGARSTGEAAEAAAAAAAAACSVLAAAASDDDDGGDSFDFDDFGSGSDDDKALPALLERPCSHVACSARPYCLVPPLMEAMNNYDLDDVEPETIFFRKQALGRLIAAVSDKCPFPLDTRDDVHVRFSACFRVSHSLAKKSFDKLWEVVDSGDLRRNAIARAEPRIAALREMMRVPGVGRSAADHFYERGCRSVSDLLLLPEPLLSKQQKLGAKHLEDFEEPIPRAEVAVVERAFRVAAAHVWAEPRVWAASVRGLPASATEESLLLPPPRETGSSSSFACSPSFLEVRDGEAGERAFVAAVGSYWRGNRATAGDIDILLSPPPPPPPRSRSTEETTTAPTKAQLVEVLDGFRGEMRRLGFELEEGSSSLSSPSSKGKAAAAAAAGNGDGDGDGIGIAHASWSGAIRCPARLLEAAGLPSEAARPRFRRIDIKIYPRVALPAALNYFSSGTTFSRCIRQWARADSAAARAALQPLAQKAAKLAFARSDPVRGPATTGEDPLQADSFHLSDSGLEVTRRGEPGSTARVSPYVDGKRGSTRVRNPHAFFSPSVFVPLECETELFEALGLEYCPPHLRFLD